MLRAPLIKKQRPCTRHDLVRHIYYCYSELTQTVHIHFAYVRQFWNINWIRDILKEAHAVITK